MPRWRPELQGLFGGLYVCASDRVISVDHSWLPEMVIVHENLTEIEVSSRIALKQCVAEN